MQFTLKLIIPFIGAFIGWLTNVIAIKLLFHPYKRIFGIQGVLPRYQMEIAERIGDVAKEHLFDNKTLLEIIRPEDIKNTITPLITKLKNPVMTEFLKNLIDPLAYLLKEYLSKTLKNSPNIIEVDKIVAEKVKGFDLRQLEKIAYRASGPELRFIQFTGAVLGFIISGIQVIVTISLL